MTTELSKVFGLMKRSLRSYRLHCVCAGLFLAAAVHAQTAAADLAASESRLRAAEAALLTAQHDYAMASNNGDLSGNEGSDYRGFVAHLQRQLGEACADFRRRGGDMHDHQAVCSAAQAYMQAQQPRQAPPAGAVADAELDAAVAKFDDMLLNQQHLLNQHARVRDSASSGGGGGGGGGGSGEGAQGDGQNGQGGQGSSPGDNRRGNPFAGRYGQGQPPTGSGSGRSIGPSGAGKGKPKPGAGSVPPDIPDGQDDDVVARQLREAAMAETDPELQKRLWDEYRKYKRGSGG